MVVAAAFYNSFSCITRRFLRWKTRHGFVHRRADIYPGFPGSREFDALAGLDAINLAYF